MFGYWKIIRNKTTFRKALLIVFLFLNVFLFGFFMKAQDPGFKSHYYYINYCYSLKLEKGVLPELDHLHLHNKVEKRIFFIESSCRDDIDPKQACALETVLAKHSHWTIYLIFVGPVLSIKDNSLIKALQRKFSNLYLASIDLEMFLKNTPVEYIWTEGLLKQTENMPLHVSVFLRYLLLWKFGGIYMDLDLILVKGLEYDSPDFIGKEDDQNFGSGVIGLSNTNTGRAISNFALMSLKDFDPKSWTSIGPRLLKRVLTVICGPNVDKPDSISECPGLKVYDWDKFYPIPKNNWKLLYEKPTNLYYALQSSYGVHIWREKSYFLRFPRNSLYARIARIHCPAINYYCYKELYFGRIE